MRFDISKVTIPEDASILQAIEAINRGGVQLALVVDSDGVLKGLVTDGDIRRGLLRGIPVEASIHEVMNASPIVMRPQDSFPALCEKVASLGLRHLPLIDDAGKLVGLELTGGFGVTPGSADVDTFGILPNQAVLMAGGQGLRLRPLTEDTPKPLIPVGDKPIIEIALQNLVDQGIRQFFISVNYLAERFEAHFGDGSRWGASISYLREHKEMGTAGALGLLPSKPEHPFLVMNADVMTSVDVAHMFAYHADMNAVATVGIYTHEHRVPYGVIELDGAYVTSIREKPIIRQFVSAGIYVLSPTALDLVSNQQRVDMPDLLLKLIAANMRVVAFPIREYWIDIGKLDDLQRARQDVGHVFRKISSAG